MHDLINMLSIIVKLKQRKHLLKSIIKKNIFATKDK